MALNYLANIGRYVPELVLCMTMVGLLFVEVTYKANDNKKNFLYVTAVVGLVASFILLVFSLKDAPMSIFTGAVVIDPFSTLVKIIMVLGTLGAIYLSRESKDIYPNLKGEFVVIAVGILIGGALLASANNMLTVYLGIETLSILSYAMASLKKDEERSSEAGLKYSLYGGISAGVMLFGLSHIFGVLGTIQFSEMIPKLQELTDYQMALLMPSFLLFFVGLGYKIACVPFHMWSPDVYEGSPLPVTAFFSIVPKMAGLAAIIRVSMIFFGQEGLLQTSWIGVISIVAALTMTVGNVSAIGQKSVKRMLAYSSISHAGMMLMGVVVLNELGIRAILFYGLTYLFMTLVAFYITSFVQDKYGNDHFERFNGLIFRYPIMAIMMTIVMFSLAGIPPLSGFVAKYNIFAALVEGKHYDLAVVAGINSVIGLYYYMKIIRLMIFQPAESEGLIAGFGFTNQTVITALTVPVVTLGIFWAKIMAVIGSAKIFIQ